jgi:hypothetical protein
MKMENKNSKITAINASEKENVNAGTIMCFRRKHDNGYVYQYEVNVSSGNTKGSNAPTWVRCETLEEAIDLERVYNPFLTHVHIVRTWLPEEQRDEYIED